MPSKHKKYPPEIRNSVRELYLELDAQGNRLNTLAVIVTKVYDRYGISVDPSTIRKWAIDEGWDMQQTKMVAVGIEKAFAATRETGESLQKIKSNEIADLFKTNLWMYKKTTTILNERLETNPNQFDNKELIILQKYSIDNIIKLMEDYMKDKEYNQEVVINVIDKR